MLKIFQIIVFSFFAFACSHNEGVLQVEDKSYFKFTGNTKNVTVILNDSVPLKDISSGKVFEVRAGKYKVSVLRGNQLIVERVVMVGGSMTKEINIP